MAFSLNKSLTHLEISEPDLAEIYRSSNSAVPSEEQCGGHLCEAYVCTAREEDRFCVYVAFFDTTTQRPVILSTACDARKHSDQKRLVNEALKLTKSMGFDMEPVKLNYSAAMRQVIIRGISVMRPPTPPRSGKQHAKAVTPPVETPPPAPRQADQSKPTPGDALPHGHAAPEPEAPSPPDAPCPPEAPSLDVAALSAEVADLRKALADMELAKTETERMAEQTIMAIKLELERTTAIHRDREEASQKEADRRQERAPEGESAALRAELAGKAEALGALEEILGREVARRQEAEAKTEELDRRLERAEEDMAALRRELDRLHHDAAAERLSAEQQLSNEAAGRSAEELAAAEREQSLREELAAARHEQAAVQDTLKNVLKEQLVLANEREALRAELAVLRESARLSWQQEREGLEQEREVLLDSIRRLESEQSEACQRFEALLAEKELELNGARADLKSLSARQEQLLGERKLWDTIAGSFKKKAHKVVERLKREKQALEERLEQFEKAPLPVPSPYPRPAAEVPAVPERHVESPFASLGLAEAGSGFAGFGSFGGSSAGGGATFRHAPDMAVISYHSADDIVELYGSANVAQAAPEGRRSQLCGAYVCVVERGGKTVIHLAWHLIDSGEVLICLPERQPEGAANYARALQDAIFYFESVGFMMDRFELSRNSHRQLRALEKIGICRMDAPAAEGEAGGKDHGDGGTRPAAA